MSTLNNMLARHPLFTASPLSAIPHLIQTAIQGFDQACVSSRSDHQLYATDSGWILRIDAPGLEKEEIKISFEDQGLNIEAEHEDFALEKRFVLGNDVDTENIMAKLEDGILELTLPKTQSTKNINIQ